MTANYVADYPELCKALSSNKKIVYFCGAGVSMSLGGHNLSWTNWLLAGKQYLRHEQQAVFESLLGTKTTEELIASASYLLKQLKVAGVYKKFMDETIGSVHPKNILFSEAFRRLWRAGDFLATTNYDMQLEEAVASSGISYSSPGVILPIVLGKAENKIIHIHGMYDNANNIDDIVANQEQYDAIVKDEGAQFIQNLISTHLLVIVGCGGTMEDPNLSGFMTFVFEKLKVKDVPYFYVMRDGDTLPALPSNAIPVYYGSDYSDLPLFMSEVSLYRLRYRINEMPLLSVNPYEERKKAVSAFGRTHFSNKFNAFVGRVNEFEVLDKFLETAEQVSWWCILGEGGIGKSRLLLEWLRYIPSHWFGFFSIKNDSLAAKFVPFTDTVVIFDYVLGDEKACAETLQRLLEVFKNYSYKLRIIFVERALDLSATNNWLNSLKWYLSSSGHLDFDSGSYIEPMLVLQGLNEKEEFEYISGYLEAYLPKVPSNPYTDYCSVHISEISKKITEDFRNVMEPVYYRPLYLSIFIEVWIEKKGNISFAGAEALMFEFINKERKRWLLYFGNEKLLTSYLRVLAIACAIDIFNITDMNGYNYLENDCLELRRFFDEKSNVPGTQNTFPELFVYMSEALTEEEEKDHNRAFGTFANCFTSDNKPADTSVITSVASSDAKTKSTEKKENTTRVEEIPLVDIIKNDKFAFFTPFVKINANPEEVFLYMLEQAGVATKEDKELLKTLVEQRMQKDASMPDYAWVIEPMLPDIIKSFVVGYVVNDRDIKKFTRLAWANSVLSFEKFLQRALEDWPAKKAFQTMAVTPPKEILNYFEYYMCLLINIKNINDIETVEKNLIDTDATLCYMDFELELWRRIAVVLTERDDIDRLYDSALNFTTYVKDAAEHARIRYSISEVIEAYCVGLHNAEAADKLDRFLSECDGLCNVLLQDTRLGYVCCVNYNNLYRLKRYLKMSVAIETLWDRVLNIITVYDYNAKICNEGMEIAKKYLQHLVSEKDLHNIKLFRDRIKLIYVNCHTAAVVGVAALTSANYFSFMREAHGKFLYNEYDVIKKYYKDFPEVMRVRSSYITVTSYIYYEKHGVCEVPKSVLELAKNWSLLYPEEIEFQESYFHLLWSQFEYAHCKKKKRQLRHIISEMEAVAQRSYYSEYNEDNQMKDAVDCLKLSYNI
ncbi:MAG: SIR2 family protein [Acidaminococcaceae bacterium]|nr:SIR2 family protein [Acidaminococcaceae bacterium]